MAYRAFGNIPTTAYRPNYLKDEKRRYGQYGIDGPFQVQFQVEGPALLFPLAAIKDATTAALRRTAIAGRSVVQVDTPVDTGLLRSRWYIKEETWDAYRLSNDIYYAPPQESRVQMLERNLGRIQAILTDELDNAIPRYLQG